MSGSEMRCLVYAQHNIAKINCPCTHLCHDLRIRCPQLLELKVTTWKRKMLLQTEANQCGSVDKFQRLRKRLVPALNDSRNRRLPMHTILRGDVETSKSVVSFSNLLCWIAEPIPCPRLCKRFIFSVETRNTSLAWPLLYNHASR